MMIPTDQDILATAADTLGGLPGAKVARLKTGDPRLLHGVRPDGRIDLVLETGRHRLLAEVKRSIKGREGAIIHQILTMQQHLGVPVVLVTPHVPRPMGERLARQGVNFADCAGNAHLRLPHHTVLILGKPAPRAHLRQRQRVAVTTAWMRIAYAFLTRPDHPWTTRKLQKATGVAIGHAAELMAGLRNQGLVRRAAKRGPHVALDPPRLAQRWVEEYGAALRPRLMLGTYAPLHDDLEGLVERWKAAVLAPGRWALTGTWGARQLVGFYAGDRLALFVEPPAHRWAQTLGIVPDDRGPVTLLAPVAPLQWEDTTAPPLPVAPPLLVYTELLYLGEERAREQAQLVARAHLKELVGGD